MNDSILYDRLNRRIDWRHLATDATWDEVKNFLRSFDSYSRTERMALLMRCSSARRCVEVFLGVGSMCDAPWPYRGPIARVLRKALREVSLVDVLEPEARAFYLALPNVVSVWRGCERGCERGISWTTSQDVAEGFARGKRCVNEHPTLVQAQIPKQHIFAVFVNRNESEVALDYRRLRGLHADAFSESPH